MLSLLSKDFQLLFSFSGKTGKRKVFSLLASLVFLFVFRAVEVFLFVGVLGKLKDYSGVPFAYRTLFLFILSRLRRLSLLIKCERLFYRGEDLTALSALPLSPASIISSKLITVFLYQFRRETLLIFPLLVSYGVRFHRPAFFFFLAFLYPFFSFFFEAGIARILLPLYHRIVSYLSDRPLFFLISGLVVRGGFAFLYGKVLNLFVQLVSDQDLTLLFTTENRQKMVNRQKYLLIVNRILDFMVKGSGLHFFLWFAFALGAFLLGLLVTVPSYHAVLHKGERNYASRKKRKPLRRSPLKALCKKERQLLYSNSENLYSFTGLLLVGPYLGYLIVYALNIIFSKGLLGYYLSLFPNVKESVAYFVFVFLSMVRLSGASDYLSREKEGIVLRKIIPVSLSKQLSVKRGIPLLSLSLSLFAMALVMIFTKNRNAVNAFAAFFSSLLLAYSYSILCLRGERRNRGKQSLNASLFSYLAPLFLFFVFFLLNYLKVPFIASFFLLVFLSFIPALALFFYFKKKKNTRFIHREVNA